MKYSSKIKWLITKNIQVKRFSVFKNYLYPNLDHYKCIAQFPIKIENLYQN